MTMKQGLQLATTIITDIETSGMIDANGNLTKPTIGSALTLVEQINAAITAAGITEPAQIATLLGILSTVSKLV